MTATQTNPEMTPAQIKAAKKRQVILRQIQLLTKAGFVVSDIEEAFSEMISDADIDVRLEDHGIGHYEFWGAKGFDSRIVLAAEAQNTDTFEWVELGFPVIEEESYTTTAQHFVVTKAQYCNRTDEVYEDGYSVGIGVEGTVQRVEIERRIFKFENEDGLIERFPYFSCSVEMGWETTDVG
jgi:hypothetical protein